MTDIVDPEMRDPTLQLGALVILSIDPVASVADMQDEKASAAAALLPRGKVLVMVRRYDFDQMKLLWHTQPLSFTFICVGHGLPAEPPFACIGLSPDAVHPDSRRPILPSTPLPWSNCYLHLFDECRSIITRIHLGSTSGTVSGFSDDQMVEILNAKFADHARYDSELGSETENSYASSDEFVPQSDVVVPVSDPGEESAARLFASCDGNESGSSRSSPVEISSERPTSPCHSSSAAPSSVSNDEACYRLPVAVDLDSPACDGHEDSHSTSSTSSLGDIPKLRYRGEVWLDLDAFDDFDPPEYVIGLIDSLEAIEKEWANRMALRILANQPHTEKWANEVAAAGGGEGLADPYAGLYNPVETGETHIPFAYREPVESEDGSVYVSAEDAVLGAK